VIGEQRPRVLNLPEPGSAEMADLGLRLIYNAGMRLKPWQEWDLHTSLITRPDKLWAASDVGLVVSRQNGKGEIIIGRQAIGLFLLDEPLQVYTSHKFTTTMEMFRRLKSVILNYKPFADRVHAIRVANGDVGVELKGGQRVRFLARTADSGRGFADVSTLYLDEAMSLFEPEVEALLPTTTAARNPQVWWVGSAGIGEPSRVFARVRRRGLAGTDDQLLWAEWSIPDGADPVDESVWGFGNPGLGQGQVTMRTLRTYRGNMSAEGFAREYQGRGDWPADDTSGHGPITLDQWARVQDADSVAQDPVVLALAVSVDGSRAAIGTAGRRDDGLRHVEVIDHRAGVHWLPERLVQLRDDHKPSCIVINSAGRAGSLVPALVEAGLEVHSGKGDPNAGALVLLGGPDVTAAFGSFVSAVTEAPTLIRHRPNPEFPAITGAVAEATTRWVGQAQAWDGKNLADISTLEAVTLAAYGHAKFGAVDYDLTGSVW